MLCPDGYRTGGRHMKTVMILGAAYSQVPLYKAARTMGIRTVACSIKGDYPGFSLADESVYADITDLQAVEQACLERHVDGIASCGLDLAMRTIGYVCEKLGFSGPGKQAAEKASDKLFMKQAFQKAGVRTAPFMRVSGEQELDKAIREIGFPLMIKAVDQMGGRGISLCRSREEAVQALADSLAQSKRDYCIAEQYIKGVLFGVEGMIRNGRILFLMPVNTEAFHGQTDIPVGHSIPLEQGSECLADITEQIQKAIKALGLDNCPVNADCILQDGKTWILEMTGRSGATGLSEIVGQKYRINYYETILRLALGEEISSEFCQKQFAEAVMTHTLTADCTGTVRRIVNYNMPSDDVNELSFNIQAGDPVRSFTNGRDRIGQVVLKEKSLELCRQKLKSIQRRIRIETEEDVPLETTPIQYICTDQTGSRIFIKRDDLLPFSYGGNKVRFAYGYYRDMRRKGADAMIIYGGYSSNLCRILAQLCLDKNIPCGMVINADDHCPDICESNEKMIRAARVKEFFCTRDSIPDAVREATTYFRSMGRTPYYIYGNEYGNGNVSTPMRTYEDVYYEILCQEQSGGRIFSHIFLAGSTNATQSGLLAASLCCERGKEIIGISVNRSRERAEQVIMENLLEYASVNSLSYNRDPAAEIHVEDVWRCGGYGMWDDSVAGVVERMRQFYDIWLDPVYTGKAYAGMLRYIQEKHIADTDILFIHTGGIPLHQDYIKKYSSGLRASGRGVLC